MAHNDSKPVTHKELKGELKIFREEMRDEFKDFKQEVKEEINGFKEEMNGFKEEILHHFDVVAENIHRDVAGANHDEIALIRDKVDGHEERITTLEQRV